MSAWRDDMENAPRDGSQFLMAIKYRGGASYVVIAYAPAPWAQKRYGWWNTNSRHSVAISDSHPDADHHDCRATHWMPLPEPPQ